MYGLRQSLQLHPAAQELMWYASQLSGRRVLVREEAIPSGHLAGVNILAGSDEPHLIVYGQGQREYRDHLIAHECGHLIRFYSAKPEDRVVPVREREHRNRVAEELRSDLLGPRYQALPDHALGELLAMWHDGLVRRVVNYPADMRIARWLKESYPALHGPQRRSIPKQLSDNEKVLRPEVREFTPPKVYHASVTLNAAFARYMSLLYSDWSLSMRHPWSVAWQRGRQMADDIWTTEDAAYKSDVDSAREWAKSLGLENWFRWIKLEDMPVLAKRLQ